MVYKYERLIWYANINKATKGMKHVNTIVDLLSGFIYFQPIFTFAIFNCNLLANNFSGILKYFNSNLTVD